MQIKERIISLAKLIRSLDVSWQIYLLLLVYILIMILSISLRWEISLMLFLLLMAIFIFVIFYYEKFVTNINAMANKLSQSIQQVDEDAKFRSPIAILLYDESTDYRVRWVNPAMQHLFANTELLGKPLLTVNSQFEKLLGIDGDKKWHTVKFLDGYFKVYHQDELHSLYLMDISAEQKIYEQRKQDKIVFGYLLLDDYNEIVESMDDQQASNFDSLILKEIAEWAKIYGIFTKRIDDEKFIVILNQYILNQLEEDNFKYFEELKERNFLRNTPLSISLGVAYPDSEDYVIDLLSEQAQLNLELALGRGGDQIVVKSPNQRARFYGGKTNPTEKRTNIRSRLVFQALKSAISQADHVIITGHKTPDMDSIGSALGIYKIVRSLNKEAHIVINKSELNSNIHELLSLNEANYLTKENVLVDIKTAQSIATDKSLLVMVDHHRPSLSEADDLIETQDIVIIDHHRRGEEFPDNTVLTYIEPYASSTAELVTEFFINMHNSNESLSKFEATALLAGVIVDTNNFSARTGSRTFDVASYLKSRGADTTQIKRLLKEDFKSLLKRNQLLENTEYLEAGYAIVRGNESDIIDSIIAAQTADILLDIENVEASFVIYRRSEKVVAVSARSLGSVNVQTIMEKLGGGGHLSNAATQIKETTIQDVYKQLLECINIDN